MGLFDRFQKKVSDETVGREVPETTGAPETGAPGSVPEGGASQGIIGRFRQGLRKTSQLLNTDIRDLFKQEGRLVDDGMLDQLFAALVRTDMGAGPAGEIRDEIQREFRGRVVQMEQIQGRVQEKLLSLMAQDQRPLNLQADGPTVMIVVGVNGSGKTTSIAKLAHLLISQGKRVVLGAGDTFRAAAVQQLTVWAERLGAEIVTGNPGSDPASVAHRTVAQMLATGADVCIIDTAGRLQTQSHLMDELAKIRRVIQKQVPSGPHEVLLVLDATAGQNGLSQAKGFTEAVECTGIVLSKLDGTAKGGVIVPIRQQFQIPVKYVGVGERPEDVAPFDPVSFVAALFDRPAKSK
jgi:fused signal recognition particle receptor